MMFKNKVKRIAALFLAAALMSSPAVFAAGTEGGTQADPIQANSSATATIYIGKYLDVSQPDKFPTIDDFVFRIDNIKAWDNANVSALTNGTTIAAENMPMPIPKTDSHHKIETTSTTATRVTVGDFTGTANTNVADTTTEKYRTTPVQITFTKAGYYMYKITENAGETAAIPGMYYDQNSYYVVVYVCNKTDASGNTIDGVYVHDITSYRNNNDSASEAEPDLSDIHNVTDNNGTAAATNNYSNYAKVGISAKTTGEDPVSGLPTGPDKLEAFRFYNDQTTHDVVLTNNVTGNLGDVTKEFEFIVTLTGLEKNKTYTTNVAAQDKTAATAANKPAGNATSDTADIVALSSNAAKGTVDSTAKTFTSDSDGNATFMVRLADDETFVMNALPATSKYQVQENANDHIASFTSETTSPSTWVMSLISKANNHNQLVLGTNTETVDAVSNVPGREQGANDDNDGTVTINFKNHRDIMTPTGLPYYGDFVYVLVALALAGAAVFAVRKRKQAEAAEVE